MQFIRSALAALFFMAFSVGCQAGDSLAKSRLTIIGTDGRRHTVEVEVAANAKARETGLMNRRSLKANHGMLFVFPQPQRVMMWMKNTLLPLDMLFIDKNGKVTHIKHNAQPMDETIIDSHGVTTHVLEVKGGYAAREGVSDGATVKGPALNFAASS